MEKLFSLNWLRTYRKEYFIKDLAAGLSVAAIALPVGIAYSSIAGLPPETGLYSCIFPMIAYAIFGSSRQLIVGPDSATCILIASSLALIPVSSGVEYQSLSVMLAIITGLFCILGGFLKLGFIADFLSKPILSGYINGLAISIIIGQLGKLFGFSIISSGFIRTLLDFFSKIELTNVTVLVIGVTAFAYLRISKKFLPKFPSPLVAVILGIAVVMIFNLVEKGVVVVGKVPQGFPVPAIPAVSFEVIEMLAESSVAIVLISFCSAMLTSKSFAAKNDYTINPNKDFIALGFANIFSGIFRGFVISGADSRTAVNDSAGGKTQLVSIIASISIVIFVLFFTQYLEYLPVSVLSAIIISATIGLIDLSYMKKLIKSSPMEFWLSIITFVSVLTIGVVKAVIIAVSLAMIWLLKRAIRPKITFLAKVKGINSFQDKEDFIDAVSIPGFLILRFEASLLFFNAGYFKDKIHEIVNQQGEAVKYLVIDASPVIVMDITAADSIVSLQNELKKNEIEIYITRARPEVRNILSKAGFKLNDDIDTFSITTYQCVNELLVKEGKTELHD